MIKEEHDILPAAPAAWERHIETLADDALDRKSRNTKCVHVRINNECYIECPTDRLSIFVGRPLVAFGARLLGGFPVVSGVAAVAATLHR